MGSVNCGALNAPQFTYNHFFFFSNAKTSFNAGM